MTMSKLRNDWLIRVTEKLVVLWSIYCCVNDFFKILHLDRLAVPYELLAAINNQLRTDTVKGNPTV